MKKLILITIFVLIEAIPVTMLGGFILGTIKPELLPWDIQILSLNPPSNLNGDHSIDIPPRIQHLGDAVATVVIIFALAVAVLWCLSKIGGPLKADVKAVIAKSGGKITIVAAGIVGAFLAIAIVGVGSVYFLASHQ